MIGKYGPKNGSWLPMWSFQSTSGKPIFRCLYWFFWTLNSWFGRENKTVEKNKYHRSIKHEKLNLQSKYGIFQKPLSAFPVLTTFPLYTKFSEPRKAGFEREDEVGYKNEHHQSIRSEKLTLDTFLGSNLISERPLSRDLNTWKYLQIFKFCLLSMRKKTFFLIKNK